MDIIWNSFWGLLLNILVAINSVVHFPALAIVIFTLFMRLLTLPLTLKALRSSRNMQQIQPLVKEIQKKYAKDRQKQQEELMKLYHEYGINPAAGCFPMLVQIPVFIGLFSALQFTLQHGNDPNALRPILINDDWIPYANFAQPFLWVPNLAAHDPTYIWPILSGVFQFIQTRMSLPYRDPNQPMDQQQRFMNNFMQFMPVYIVFISAGFPAGTVIYWAFSSLFGAVQQYFITGWGSLPDLPGLGFLPRKPATPPRPPERPAQPTGSRGIMGWMMSKAVEAQQAQKAQQAQQANHPTHSQGARTGERRYTGGMDVDVDTDERTQPMPAGAHTRTTGKKAATDRVQHYGVERLNDGASSDGRNRVITRNGRAGAPAQLPRKKRSKR